MDPRLPLLLALLPLPALASPVTPLPASTDSVRVYRCVGSNGAVTLQDTACARGHQEILQMQRPQDPPPRRAASDDAATSATPSRQAPREVRHVYIAPPRPMYECVTDDGHRYVSDSNEGNPRWVSLWTTAWLPGAHRPWRGGHALPPVRPEASPTHGPGPGPGQRPPPAAGVGLSVPAGNILVRDTCHALPPQEACARLRDQRWELDRRYNSALQGERDAITREQRGIDARLQQDCGGR